MRGGLVHGKEMVKGNSPENDIVDIKASAGEIVMDKETLAKGKQAWVKFIEKEMKKHPHLFKDKMNAGGKLCYDEGGYVANPNYQGLAASFNGPSAPANAGNVYTKDTSNPTATKIREYDAVQKNLGRPLTMEERTEYNMLKAKQAAGMFKGGAIEGGQENDGDQMKDLLKSKVRLKSKAKQKFAEGGTVQPEFNPEAYLAQKSPLAAFDPEQYLAQKSDKNRPWYDVKPENLAPGFLAGLKKIDEYTGAPVRKFITEKATGQKLQEAPSGSEQAAMLGAPTTTYGQKYGVPGYLGGNVSPADIYGVGLEMAQDPLLLGGKAIEGAKGLLGIGREASEAIKAKNAASATQRQAGEATAESSAKSSANISGGGLEVNQGVKSFSYNAPKNLDELNKWTPPVGSGELPGKQRLQEIEQIVPDLEVKPLKYHYDMMENPKAMKELKTQFENLPTDSAKKIAAYNQGIVDESAQKIEKTLHDMTGNEPKNIADSGHDLISKVKDKYDLEKASLGPVFDKLQQASPLSKAESRDLAINIGENSKIGKLMQADPETGRLSLGKNTPRTGLSDAEHGAISRVVDDLNDGMSFKEIQNAREYLRKMVDPANPHATAEINNVRSIMLGQLENMAKARGDDVGSAFKDYAINERARENVEKIIGGKISDFDKMYAANPENVVKKIFSNPNYAKVVGEYVGQEKMQEMTQAFIKNGIQKAYDSADGFKPHVVRNWMKSNQQFLNANVDPKVLNRLSALADYGQYGKKFLAEVNPSGTAASLKAMLEPGSFFSNVKQHGFVGAVESTVANKVQAVTQQKQAVKAVNEAFGTKTPSAREQFKNMNLSQPMSKYMEAQAAAALGRGTIKDKGKK